MRSSNMNSILELFNSRKYSWIDSLGMAISALFAFLLRLFHVRSGLPYIHHWDEPYVAFRALDMMRTGDLNPYFYFYGSLLMYINAGVDWLHALYLKSLPETSVMALNEINPLAYGGPTGFDWYISHPSFLFWNRTLTAVFGALTVAVVYTLALRLLNRMAALSASLLLAGTLVHIEHSAFVTTDIPMGFFVWAAILFALLFYDKQKLKYLIISLVLSGLGTSIKYNAGLVVIVPALALLFSRKNTGYRPWHWALIPAVPALAFFIGTPYALVDVAEFIDHAVYNVLIYSQSGPSWATIQPGLPHILYQGGIFLTNISLFAALLALVGLPKLLSRKPFGWFMLGYALLYFLSTTRMKISYHRNFLLLYPQIAILFGSGIALFMDWLSDKKRWRIYLQGIVVLGVSVFLAWFSLSALKQSWRTWRVPESRTRAVLQANQWLEDEAGTRVGIAAELKLHPWDLAQLEGKYEEAPLLQLLADPAKFDLILAFSEIGTEDHDLREQAQQINRLLWRIPEGLKTYIGSGVLNLRTYSVDPGVVILTDMQAVAEAVNGSQP